MLGQACQHVQSCRAPRAPLAVLLLLAVGCSTTSHALQNALSPTVDATAALSPDKPLETPAVVPASAQLAISGEKPVLAQTTAPDKPERSFRAFEPPSNDRDWSPDMKVLSWCEFLSDDAVVVHNVRNCDYQTADIYTVNLDDRRYDLSQIKSLDFFICPFTSLPVAHTFLSFGFEGDKYLCVSVEIRRERGEKYAPFRGIFNQFEIMYVMADERDVIGLRTNHRGDELFMYRIRVPRDAVKGMFVDVCERVNRLAKTPEYYHTINNNCTTAIFDHMNHVLKDKLPYNYQVLLPALADQLVFDHGLLETDTTFERTKLRARINEIAYIHRDAPDFSRKIREPRPLPDESPAGAPLTQAATAP